MDTCKYFEKMYHFTRYKEDWSLPSPDKFFQSDKWELPMLMNLKRHLNEVKGRLNDFPLQKWHRHTGSMNPAGLVVRKLRHELEPAFLTQAWCKFYETVSTFGIIPSYAKGLRALHTVHLCEAPGAFVSALNHYLVSKLPDIKWDWMATTLNPHHESNDPSSTVLDDRLILTTHEHWTYGADLTGDIMKAANMQHILKEAKRRGLSGKGSLLLVTADGSIDCQKNPAEQESNLSNLHLCEAVTAMLLLDPGGSLLLKAFTIFESESVCLLFLLSCCFKSIVAWKPATSREGNSEMYLVCLNYLGKEMLQPWLDALSAEYGKGFDSPLFSLDALPSGFLRQVVACAKVFMDYQITAIEKNINTFVKNQRKSKNAKNRKLCSYPLPNAVKIQNDVAEAFLQRYGVEKIPREAEIFPSHNDASKINGMKWFNDLNDQSGELTFNKKMKKSSHLDIWESLSESLKNSPMVKKHYNCDPMAFFFHSVGVAVCKIPTLDIDLDLKDVTIGIPINEVLSSKFCHVWFMNLHKQIQQLCINLNISCVNESIVYSDAIESGINASCKGNKSRIITCTENSEEKVDAPAFSGSIGRDISVGMANNYRTEGEDDNLMAMSEVDGLEDGEAIKRYCTLLQLKTLIDDVARKEYAIFLWSDNMPSKKLEELIDMVNRVKEGGSLMIQNPFPLFKKFEVGIIYILGLLFNQLLFIWPSSREGKQVEYSILLNGRYGPSDYQTKIQNFLHKITKLACDEENKTIPHSILDVVPLNLLCVGCFNLWLTNRQYKP